jgi:hypothetical protein
VQAKVITDAIAVARCKTCDVQFTLQFGASLVDRSVRRDVDDERRRAARRASDTRQSTED